MNNRPYRTLILGICLVFFIHACKKEQVQAGEQVEIYLLKTTQFVAGACQVDASNSVIQETAFVKNEDILSYSPTTFQFTFSKTAFDKLKTLSPRTVIAIVIDKQVLYYSIYFPMYFSSSCDKSIVWDFSLDQSLGIIMKLGYPGLMQGVNITDDRNNEKLILTLKKQGKLI